MAIIHLSEDELVERVIKGVKQKLCKSMPGGITLQPGECLKIEYVLELHEDLDLQSAAYWYMERVT